MGKITDCSSFMTLLSEGVWVKFISLF